MILTTLVGNTNTRFTWFADRRVTRQAIVPTTRLQTARRRALPDCGPVEAVALASVVPTATMPLRRTLRAATGRSPFVLDVRARTQLRMRYDRRELGADRLCACEGAWSRYHDDCIVIDFGTAVTVDAVTGKGHLLGGTIMPGLHLMTTSLGKGAARLPDAEPRVTGNPLQSDTHGAIQAGTAGMLLGGVLHIIKSIETRTGRTWNVVITGGGAARFRRHLGQVRHDPDLAARGLLELLLFNQKQR